MILSSVTSGQFRTTGSYILQAYRVGAINFIEYKRLEKFKIKRFMWRKG